jgi:glycosyltransferase involved in cell wall biosynthesis
MESEKKKILYVITKSNLGGAQRYVYDLVTNLPAHLYEVAVATGGEGVLVQKLSEAGIRTFNIPSFERDINLGKELRAASELKDIIRAYRPDIIHLNSSKAGGTGALVARLLRVPHIVFTAHGWPFNEKRSFMWRKMVWFLSWLTAFLSHTVILVSQYDYEHSNMRSLQKKFKVIPTGIARVQLASREEARHALLSPEIVAKHASDFWLVSTAELTRNKNLSSAIRAVATYNETHDRKIFYSIMGEGELRRELDALILASSSGNYIRLLGFVNGAQTYLSAFDGFLLSSEKEGMPYALLEAGSARLPVIASRIGGIPSMIRDGNEGILVNPHDVKSIVKALERIAGYRGHAEILASTLQSRVHNEFSLKRMVEATQSLYARP